MASGHVYRANRPNTSLLRPSCKVQILLASPEPSTWPITRYWHFRRFWWLSGQGSIYEPTALWCWLKRQARLPNAIELHLSSIPLDDLVLRFLSRSP